MNLFNELTQFGVVMDTRESDNHITYKMRMGRKKLSLSYYFTDEGWDYEITNKFGRVVDNGTYACIA